MADWVAAAERIAVEKREKNLSSSIPFQHRLISSSHLSRAAAVPCNFLMCSMTENVVNRAENALKCEKMLIINVTSSTCWCSWQHCVAASFPVIDNNIWGSRFDCVSKKSEMNKLRDKSNRMTAKSATLTYICNEKCQYMPSTCCSMNAWLEFLIAIIADFICFCLFAVLLCDIKVISRMWTMQRVQTADG